MNKYIKRIESNPYGTHIKLYETDEYKVYKVTFNKKSYGRITCTKVSIVAVFKKENKAIGYQFNEVKRHEASYEINLKNLEEAKKALCKEIK